MTVERVFLSLREFAQRIGFSQSTLRRLKKQGKLRYLQPSGKGGKLLIPLDALEQAMVELNASATAGVQAHVRHLPGKKPLWMEGQTKE